MERRNGRTERNCWDWIEEPLLFPGQSVFKTGRLIRLAGEIEQFSLQEDMENDFREQISKWAEMRILP
ncbi:MAG: hypothetical protein Ct9H300mP21_11360 [Pseudomonadota bacterium]|nr:MAG: hypothetical protein Ct9H300mP21_11360 [Pseudomonadota bacterium]